MYAKIRCTPITRDALDRLAAVLQELTPNERPEEAAEEVNTVNGTTVDATAVGAFLVDWAGRIQRHGRFPVSRRSAVERYCSLEAGADDILVYFPYLDLDVTRSVFHWLATAISVTASDGTFDPHAAKPSWQELEAAIIKRAPPGLNTFRFVMAAEDTMIPVTPLPQNVFRFGQGRRSRLLESSSVDTTSRIGVRFARSKFATAVVLREAGLPVPSQILVSSATAAVAASQKLGYPVVVKPENLDGGLGVSAGLLTDEEVESAFARAQAHSSRIIVETHAEGYDHRFLVFGGEVVQVFRREAASVTGNGRSTLTELVAAAASTPEAIRRNREFRRLPLSLDNEAIELARKQGLEASNVVPKGAVIQLRRKSNVSAGGSVRHFDIDAVHPDLLSLARRAAHALRLDPAGVDLITPDVSRSWIDGPAVICEVNAVPQMSITGSQDLHARLLNRLLGSGPDTRLWACLCETMSNDVFEWFRTIPRLGVAAATGVWLNGEQIARPSLDTFDAARCLLSNTEIDIALIQVRPEDLASSGSPCPRWDGLLVAPDSVDALGAAQSLAPNIVHDAILTSEAAKAMGRNLAHLSCEIAQDPWAALSTRLIAYVRGRSCKSDVAI
jgi:cyanophycin synthetase